MAIVPLSNFDSLTFRPAAPAARSAPLMDAPPAPPLLDTLGAAFRLNNTVGAVFAARDGLSTEERDQVEEGFNAWNEIKGTPYEQHWDAFVEVRNRRALTSMQTRIDRENEDRQTLAAAGPMGWLASFGAGIVDLPSLLPGGAVVGAARGGYYAGRGGVSIVQSVGRVGLAAAAGGARVGLAAAGGAAATEAVLEGAQVTHTAQEAAFAIGGSALLGMFIGGGVAGAAGILRALSRTELQAGAAALTRIARGEDGRPGAPGALISAGAAAVGRDTLDDLTIAGRAAGGVAESTRMLNPVLRLMTSPDQAVRSVAANLMEIPVYLRKNLSGEGDQAVETLVKEYTQGAAAKAVQATQEGFAAYRRGGGALSGPEFRAAVGRAMRRGDDSPVPEVAAAARSWRTVIFDPLKNMAIEAGLLPKDVSVKGAASYFSRIWNVPRIEAQEARFKAVITNWAKRWDGVDADYADDIAASVFNQITGRTDVFLPRDVVLTTRGPLKGRTLNIPDDMIEEFLEDDIELVGRRYARIMAAEIEMTRKFGSADLRDTIATVTQSYERQRLAVQAGPGTAAAKEKQLTALGKHERADRQDIEAVRDMLRGTYMARQNATPYARTLAALGTFNYLRSLGGQTISSLTDIARPMMVHGLGRFMAQGVVPLVTNLKAIKLSVAEARNAGAVAERILATRMATLAELTDPYSAGTPFERFLRNAANGFSRATGMVYWNDWMKSFSSVLTQNRILEAAANYAGAPTRERRYLAFLGVDEVLSDRIAAEFKAHGQIDGNVRIANTHEWDDIGARRAFRAAVNKDVDSTIVTKGVGDTPLFSHTPTGRALLQFKSFALASHQRAFMRGLQAAELGVDGGRIAGAVAATMTATTVGMFIYWLKAIESNRAGGLSDNPGHWLAEGLDRSGLFAIAFEANNTLEKAFGYGGYGALEQMFPGASQAGKASRYLDRSIASTMAGPSADLVDTLVRVIQGLKSGPVTASDIRAIWRLIPGATLPGLRSIAEYGVLPR